MITFTDILDRYREEIYNIFEKPYSDEIDFLDIINKIEEIKNNDKIYKTFITIIFLDDFKIKNHYQINLSAEEDEIETFKYYIENIKNIDDLLGYAEDLDNIIEMIPSTLIFNKINSKQKREVMSDCERFREYLTNISCFHTLDQLFYALPVTPYDMVEKYYEYEQEENIDSKMEAKVEFSRQMLDLFVADTTNYQEIVKKLVETYRIVEYNKIFVDDTLNNKLDCDILELCNLIYRDTTIRQKLLDYYLEYNILCNKEERKTFKEEYLKNKKIYKKKKREE